MVTAERNGLAPGEQVVRSLQISEIRASGFNPRKAFDEERLRELAESMAAHGLIQPVLVREEEGGGYCIIAGQRRLRAARLAGFRSIPAIVRSGVTDVEAIELAIIENMQRVDLDCIEEAEGYRDLIELAGMTQVRVAAAVNRSQGWVSTILRLLTSSGTGSGAYQSGPTFFGSRCRASELCGVPGRVGCHRGCGRGAWPYITAGGSDTGCVGTRRPYRYQSDPAGAGGSDRGIGDPCSSGPCPFHARFGDICLASDAHSERALRMNRESEPSRGLTGKGAAASERVVERSGQAKAERALPTLSSGGSVRARLKESIGRMDATCHRSLVVLALLALRWCRVGGRLVDGGEFAAEGGVPCAGSVAGTVWGTWTPSVRRISWKLLWAAHARRTSPVPVKGIGNDLRWWNTCWKEVCLRGPVVDSGGRGEDLLSFLAWMEVTLRLLGRRLSMCANMSERQAHVDYGGCRVIGLGCGAFGHALKVMTCGRLPTIYCDNWIGRRTGRRLTRVIEELPCGARVPVFPGVGDDPEGAGSAEGSYVLPEFGSGGSKPAARTGRQIRRLWEVYISGGDPMPLGIRTN